MEENQASEIVPCDVDEYCSGHAMKCMQRGDRQKCKCDVGWGGKDCSNPITDESIGETSHKNNSELGGETQITDIDSTVIDNQFNKENDNQDQNYGNVEPNEYQAEVNDNNDVNEFENLSETNGSNQVFGGIIGIVLIFVILYFYKKRSSQSGSASSAKTADTAYAPVPSAPPMEQQWEDWDDDDDDVDDAPDGDCEMQPVKEVELAPVHNTTSPTTNEAPSQNIHVHELEKSSSLSRPLPSAPPISLLPSPNTTHIAAPPPKKNLGLSNKPTQQPKRSAAIDDYPPLATDNAAVDSLFMDMGISAKPTFVKASAPQAAYIPSSKLALGDEDGGGGDGGAWGDDEDDGLDDL